VQGRSTYGLLTAASVALAAAVGVATEAGSSPPVGVVGERFVATVAAKVRAHASLPPSLRQTGLYADWESKQVAADVLSFTPQYPLWSDGAKKRRWLRLPPGTSVDASDPEAFRFPVGTRVWKDLSFGRRVETRFMVLGATGWRYAAYVWSADGAEAFLSPARGWDTGVEVAPTLSHLVPSEGECRACHANAKSPVLGFSTLQLSDDRDPGAPHAEPLADGALGLGQLVRAGLVRGLPEAMIETPPRIVARTPTERAARGYLHANCGSCHRAEGPLASLNMVLADDLGAGRGAEATTARVSSRFSPAGLVPGEVVRVAPGHPEASVLVRRMGTRDPLAQMPPLGTRVVDPDGVRLISRWIDELAPSPSRP
jgi:hypothetical protein